MGWLGIVRKIAVIFALLSAVDVARAGDFPEPSAPPPPPVMVTAAPIYNWTGVYIGINGGWQSQHVSDTVTLTDLFGGGGVGGFPLSTATGSNSGNAAVAGGQASFNWQADWAVFGIEGDFDWSRRR
jgi:outer membrane immunogenic protein